MSISRIHHLRTLHVHHSILVGVQMLQDRGYHAIGANNMLGAVEDAVSALARWLWSGATHALEKLRNVCFTILSNSKDNAPHMGY